MNRVSPWVHRVRKPSFVRRTRHTRDQPGVDQGASFDVGNGSQINIAVAPGATRGPYSGLRARKKYVLPCDWHYSSALGL
jgi:hypothetical protein